VTLISAVMRLFVLGTAHQHTGFSMPFNESSKIMVLSATDKEVLPPEVVEASALSGERRRPGRVDVVAPTLLPLLRDRYLATPPAVGNAALSRPLSSLERADMIESATQKIAEILDVLKIDHAADHNTRDTPGRVARMFVDEMLAGRYTSPPKLTKFDNPSNVKELIVTGPIALRSTCAHHLMPIYGEAYIGVLPSLSGGVIGLSKYDRVVEHFAARLQIQEELTHQIGAYLMEQTLPSGLAVRVSAVHMCKTHRGVRASHASRMVTSEYFGSFSDRPDIRVEFVRECVSLEEAA
jgi:GTP cyclohydrolase IA